MLIDPNTFTADGTDSVGSLTVSPDGALACYGRSEGGSDWETFVLLDLATGEQVDDRGDPDQVQRGRHGCPTAARTSTSTSRTRGTPTAPRPARSAAPGCACTGSASRRDDDAVILEFPENDQLIMWPELSHDHRYVVVKHRRGYREPQPAVGLSGARPGRPEPTRRAHPADRRPRGRVRVRPDGRHRVWCCVPISGAERSDRQLRSGDVRTDRAGRVHRDVAEGEDTIEVAVAAGETVVTGSLRDASPVLRRYALDGTLLGELAVPGGAVAA